MKPDPAKLCVHTATTKPLPLTEALDAYAAAGIPSLTVWRDTLEGRSLQESARLIKSSGLKVASLCRGGFFPALSPNDRRKAIDDNRLAIDQAAAIGAPLVVLVCGAVPGLPLSESRAQIADGIASCLDHAKAAGITLAIEPLHPMYAGDRSAINTLAQAIELCDQLNSPSLGIAADVYHLWWDPRLEADISAAGLKGYLAAFHVCDWLNPTTDLLNDRGLMGEGCINIPQIRSWIEAAGFEGFVEVEIFSNRWWAHDQHDYLQKIKQAYYDHC
ncbi:MAG: sugar phosphate isomerase/epimerase family protein [Verrucomicrobiota bacterium]